MQIKGPLLLHSWVLCLWLLRNTDNEASARILPWCLHRMAWQMQWHWVAAWFTRLERSMVWNLWLGKYMIKVCS